MLVLILKKKASYRQPNTPYNCSYTNKSIWIDVLIFFITFETLLLLVNYLNINIIIEENKVRILGEYYTLYIYIFRLAMRDGILRITPPPLPSRRRSIIIWYEIHHTSYYFVIIYANNSPNKFSAFALGSRCIFVYI